MNYVLQNIEKYPMQNHLDDETENQIIDDETIDQVVDDITKIDEITKEALETIIQPKEIIHQKIKKNINILILATNKKTKRPN